MLTVTTYAELADAVRRDETMLRLESEAKYFYEKKSYKSALNELEKVSGYRDADELITRCKRRS